MSAVAGFWSFDGDPAAGRHCGRMLAAQEMYGPHDGRQWADGSIAMGRRLFRTLPEDAHDRQPLHDPEGRFTLVADVRLDNREELAASLGLPAAEAARLCDAQILLASLVRWEAEALDHLIGDFAFALWDSRAQKLLLARDFLGQRPLHYHCGKHFFAFATMPKGLHALPEVPYAPDEQALAEFVTLMPEGGTRSFFEGIERVGAGHFVTVSREGVTARRYWQPSRPEPGRTAPADHAEGLRHHLDQATRSRLRGAGGAVATHLSGGYDSAAVTATAARLLASERGKAVAFTAVPRQGYEGPAPAGRIGDEGPLAAATAALYPNIEHVLIRAGHRSPLEHLDRTFYLFDRPALNLCNQTWTFAINQAARERGLRVLLVGIMGNMTISYDGIALLPELLRAGRLVEAVRQGGRLVASGNMRLRSALAASLGPFLPASLWRRLGKAFGRPWDVLHYTAIRRERVDELREIARERKLDFSHRPGKDGFESRLWVLRRVDLGNYNKGTLAGWGLDQRDPTADRRLVEYCLATPMEEFLAGGQMRALGRRALADRLPEAVLSAPGRGYQGVDWHEGLTAARGEVEAQLERLSRCAPVGRTLDIARLRSLVEDWPDSGWERREVSDPYRLALLRGVSSGDFLRKASRSNE